MLATLSLGVAGGTEYANFSSTSDIPIIAIHDCMTFALMFIIIFYFIFIIFFLI